MLKEIITVNSGNNKEAINTLCKQRAEVLVKVGETRTYH
jgi:hypothetical protein